MGTAGWVDFKTGWEVIRNGRCPGLCHREKIGHIYACLQDTYLFLSYKQVYLAGNIFAADLRSMER